MKNSEEQFPDMSTARSYYLPNAKIIRYTAWAFALLMTLVLAFRFSHTTGFEKPSQYKGQTVKKLSAARQKSLEPILNTTLGFEAILALNLPERTDHRDGLILASAVSDLRIDFINGIHGSGVLDKVLPPIHIPDPADPVKGSWRAHINALTYIVEKGLSSALILEDDVDWDIRLKSQMQDVALASDYIFRSSPNDGAVYMRNIETHSIPKMSPYGDGWDAIWLGHCAMDLPDTESTVALLDDESAPEPHYQRGWDVKVKSPMIRYSNHTRAVMAQHGGSCSLAYAVSQKGARQLLLALGLRRFDGAFDLGLRDWCQGDNGHEKHVCAGILPPLFDHHRRAGPLDADSDIATPNGGLREKTYTANIRWSVRLNMDKLLRGDTDYDDQYPDTS